MIKYICDICGKDIEDLNYQGQFQIKQKHLTFIKHNKESQVRILGYLMCCECAEKVLEQIKAFQRSFRDIKINGSNN